MIFCLKDVLTPNNYVAKFNDLKMITKNIFFYLDLKFLNNLIKSKK
jgi:hypothetical protein